MVDKIPVVILAREGSERYPGKHLHPIRGVPMIWGILKRLQNAGYRPIIATGRRAENRRLAIAAGWTGAEIYCEDHAPEWDLVTRMINMALKFKLKCWIEYSGDCPFVDMGLFPVLWETINSGGYWKAGFSAPYSTAIPDRGAQALHIDWLMFADKFFDADDRRREQPWVHIPPQMQRICEIEPRAAREKTPIKTSIDWPMEGAIADFIVRYLGHWPESDEDIERVYREVTVLSPEVDNTPMGIAVFNSANGETNPLVEREKDSGEEGI